MDHRPGVVAGGRTRAIAIFQTELSQGMLIEINGDRLENTRRTGLLGKLHELISADKPEIALIEHVLVVAGVHSQRTGDLIAEYVLRRELFAFPAPCKIAGIGNGRMRLYGFRVCHGQIYKKAGNGTLVRQCSCPLGRS